MHPGLGTKAGNRAMKSSRLNKTCGAVPKRVLEPYHSFEVAHLPQVVPGLETYPARLLIDGIPVIGNHVMLMADPERHDIRHFNAFNLLHGGDHLPEPLTSAPSIALRLTLDAVGHYRAATDGHRVEHAFVKCPDAVHSVWHVGLRSASGPNKGEEVLPGEPPRIWRQVTADGDVTDFACAPRRVKLRPPNVATGRSGTPRPGRVRGNPRMPPRTGTTQPGLKSAPIDARIVKRF